MFYSKLIKIKNNIHLSQLSLIGGGLALLMLSPSVAAIDCEITNSNEIPVTNFNLHRNMPINHSELILKVSNDFKCEGANINNTYIDFEVIPNISNIPGLPNIYQTNLRGIGIKYEIDNSQYYNNVGCNNQLASHYISNITTTGHSFSCHNTQGTVFATDVFSLVSIVKLDANHEVGRITNLPKFSSNYFVYDKGPASGKTLNNIFETPDFLVIRRNGCTLDSNRLDFNLGKNQQNDFKRIGTTGTPITKQIPLTCDPDTKYFLQVDGVAEPNHPGVMKLTSDPGAATGVGVQLLANGQPVEFGRAKQMGTSAASGNNIKETIDITAQYYQTQNRVTPGPANASATFTMTYQ
ncbi:MULTISPECIES: fimbrial protein [Yersinia]|uniref:Fimbrial subunit n=1 Tax=Yersinia frederiksenii TaxID=29484 RepID=A0AAI8ZSZ3_YERFR|nr:MULTISPECIES: fimbrial protein [Yersinia]MDN0126991.1 fimbrial protein [Yersinia massiliensis]CFR07655.1 putative fimbrial subunit [Yersinia frederiksenii]